MLLRINNIILQYLSKIILILYIFYYSKKSNYLNGRIYNFDYIDKFSLIYAVYSNLEIIIIKYLKNFSQRQYILINFFNKKITLT